MPNILSVSLENHPGSLAEALEILGRAEINIEAVEANAQGEFGTLRLLVNKPSFAAELLRQDGYDVIEAPAFIVTLPNRHGELAKVARKMAEHKLNIVALFGTSGSNANEVRILLRVAQLDAAKKVLSDMKLKIEH